MIDKGQNTSRNKQYKHIPCLGYFVHIMFSVQSDENCVSLKNWIASVC